MKHEITGTSNIVIDAPASTVWDALINPDLIKKYLFGTNATSNWKVGSALTFEGEHDGKRYKDKGTILAKKSNKLLRYSYWSSLSGMDDKPENYYTVTYKLSEEANKTTVTVIQENIKTQQAKQHSESNWKKVLEKLKEVVESQTIDSTHHA
jgi:uncharacterized protein YndB with AHSA1/START domain